MLKLPLLLMQRDGIGALDGALDDVHNLETAKSDKDRSEWTITGFQLNNRAHG